MYRMFIVEDDRGIAEGISNCGEKWGMECLVASDFSDIMKEFAAFSPHIVILDISLPFFNGYHWCSEIRRVSKVPVIFISSAGDNLNIVMAVNMGADDFVIKPFDIEVLFAKINALLRRTYTFSENVSVIEHRGALLNTSDCTFVYKGKTVELSKNEYRILFTLLENKGKVVSREKLMEYLWQTDSYIDENTLTVNVARLRKKLEAYGLNDYITTKFGVGYIIEQEVK